MTALRLKAEVVRSGVMSFAAPSSVSVSSGKTLVKDSAAPASTRGSFLPAGDSVPEVTPISCKNSASLSAAARCSVYPDALRGRCDRWADVTNIHWQHRRPTDAQRLQFDTQRG